ncbi:MAG: hypothetical protein IPI97_15495 [Nitrosomonas sp.]|nr:hypothetical protein [Nitrosomonas sp.]
MQTNLINARSPVALPLLSSLPLPDPYTRLNRTGLLFIGQVFSLSDFFKIKLSGWLTRERLEQRTSSETTYLVDSLNLQISEVQHNILNPQQYTAQLESTYLPKNQHHALRIFARFNYLPSSAVLDLNRTATSTLPLHVNQQITESPLDWLVAVEYTFRRTDQTVWQFTAKQAGYHNQAQLYALYSFYPLFFNLDSTFLYLNQPVDLRQNRTIINGKYWSTRWGTIWKLEAGLDWEHNYLQATASLENGLGEQHPAGADFENQLEVRIPTWYGRWSADRTLGALRIFASLEGFYAPAHWEIDASTTRRTTLRGFEPLAFLEYVFDEKNTLSAGYRSRQERPLWINMHEDYLFSDYQTPLRGLPGIFLMPSQRVTVDYYFRDRPKQFLIHVGGSTQHDPQHVGSQYEIGPYLQLTRLFRPVTSLAYTLTTSGSRYFPRLNMLFDVDINVIAYREQAQVNGGSLSQLSNRLYTLHGQCGTSFDGWVNFIFSHQWSSSMTPRVGGPFAAHTNFSSLQLTVKPTGRFYTKLYLYQMIN